MRIHLLALVVASCCALLLLLVAGRQKRAAPYGSDPPSSRPGPPTAPTPTLEELDRLLEVIRTSNCDPKLPPAEFQECLGEAASEPLYSMLTSGETRAHKADLLARLRAEKNPCAFRVLAWKWAASQTDEDVRAVLSQIALTGPTSDHRYCALLALLHPEQGTGPETLRVALSTLRTATDPHLIAAALWIVEVPGATRSPELVTRTRSLLGHEDPEVRARAAAALVHRSSDARDIHRALDVIETLTDDKRWIVLHALEGTTPPFDDRAILRLKTILDSIDPRVRQQSRIDESFSFKCPGKW
jgi:hypothetical protein